MLNQEKTNLELGESVNKYLEKKGVQTPINKMALLMREDLKLKLIELEFRKIMETLGLDLNDDSLVETPKRIAKMFVKELYWGLLSSNFPKMTTVENKMNYDEMIVEKDIKVMSDCEHHFRTIYGKAHIAYIPNKHVLGLSKMNRIVEYFARRPQIQERLTEQIFHALKFILKTKHIAVIIDAEHMCVKQRGIEDINSSTRTSKLGGVFKSSPKVRAELFSLIK